ncbi:MAG TPA: NIPSNAP family protein [Saprospiraceae bacterium]|nr:NIPSNAP family protein [Saprospiraceae bacterium]
MILFLTLLGFILSADSPIAVAAKKENRVFELRIYHCEPGKLNDLIARFQNHTTSLFEKHGMTNIGYWVPMKEDNQSLYYVLAYPDLPSREASWKSFSADPTWNEVRKKSEEQGKIVKSVESVFMNPEDFSPAIRPKASKKERVFELRIYTCHPGRLPALEKRFRDHTLKLFKKHGMTNIAYWKSVEKDGQQPRLIYFLAHESEPAGKASFASFGKDPEWIRVRDESERDGKIVQKLESIYMKALPFSAYR